MGKDEQGGRMKKEGEEKKKVGEGRTDGQNDGSTGECNKEGREQGRRKEDKKEVQANNTARLF